MANDAAHNFIYGCNDDRFEEVMVYHHLDKTQRKLQSLGFTGSSSVYARPIPVHAHFAPGCNAFYSPIDVGLHFFDGGVSPDDPCPGGYVTDSAEDADVIIHEYGHALQADITPGWGFGAALAVDEALSMGEGFADFLQAVMSGDPCVS